MSEELNRINLPPPTNHLNHRNNPFLPSGEGGIAYSGPGQKETISVPTTDLGTRLLLGVFVSPRVGVNNIDYILEVQIGRAHV